MRKIFIPTVIAVSAISLSTILSSHSRGPQAAAAGSPLENSNCTMCHSGNAPNSGAGGIEIGTPMDYTPGETYTISVDVTDENASVYGFQLVALNSDDEEAGELIAGDKTETTRFNGATYIQQSETSSTGSFSFEWKAPSSDVGGVTFYVAGNAANGNGSTSGDYIYLTNHTVSSTITSVAQVEAEKSNLTVFPNPSTNGSVTISQETSEATLDLEVYNVAGQLIETIKGFNGNYTMSNLESGVYWIYANDGEVSSVEKFVVQ